MVKSGCEVHFEGPDGLYLFTSFVQVVLTWLEPSKFTGCSWSII